MEKFEYFVRKIVAASSIDDSHLASTIELDSDSDFYSISLLDVFKYLNNKYDLTIEDCEEQEWNIINYSQVLEDFDNFVSKIDQELTEFESGFLTDFKELMSIAIEKQLSIFFIL